MQHAHAVGGLLVDVRLAVREDDDPLALQVLRQRRRAGARGSTGPPRASRSRSLASRSTSARTSRTSGLELARRVARRAPAAAPSVQPRQAKRAASSVTTAAPSESTKNATSRKLRVVASRRSRKLRSCTSTTVPSCRSSRLEPRRAHVHAARRRARRSSTTSAPSRRPRRPHALEHEPARELGADRPRSPRAARRSGEHAAARHDALVARDVGERLREPRAVSAPVAREAARAPTRPRAATRSARSFSNQPRVVRVSAT